MSRPAPIAIRGTAVVGGGMYAPPLSGTITGALDLIRQNDVEFEVTDSGGLFQSGNFYLDRTVTPATWRASFGQEVFKTAGHFSGNLRLRFCLDTACKQPFSGAPIVVPYDVTVQAGLTLSRNEFTVSVPFGTVPPPEVIDVTTSMASKAWTATRTTPYVGSYLPNPADVADPGSQQRTGNKLELRFSPEKPGEHIETFKVSTYADYGNSPVNPGREFVETVKVRYLITPNPALDIVFFPASLEFTQKQGTSSRDYPHYFVTNTNVTANYEATEYLTSAGNAGPVNRWFNESQTQGMNTCEYVQQQLVCLVPGLYTARMRYRVTSPGGAHLMYVPIKLNVTK